MAKCQQYLIHLASIILVLLSGKVLALPHEVKAMPRTTDALSLSLYVRSSIGHAHFVAVQSSAKVVPTSVTAELVVNPSGHDVLKERATSHGSFSVRAGERSTHVIDGLVSGEAYDVYFVVEAAQSNGLFSHVGRALGVSTNGAAPSISHLAVAPVDARVDAAQLSLTTDDTSRAACRVLYTVQRLDDEAHYKREPFEPRHLTTQDRRNASVIDLSQGLREQSPVVSTIEGLESDSWYQITAVTERAEGVFSTPAYALVRTHREPPRVLTAVAHPVKGSTDTLALVLKLDCSSSPVGETVCGVLRYDVYESPSAASPAHAKARQVSRGETMVPDGRRTVCYVSGLKPGKAYSIASTVETPGSNGIVGSVVEATATTFPRAPRLVSLSFRRSEADTSVLKVDYELAEPGLVHIDLSEEIGHPMAMRMAAVGRPHGVSFSREVGLEKKDEEADGGQGTHPVLRGSQELHGLAPGSAFKVTARTEAALAGHASEVYGDEISDLIHAVPPDLVDAQTHPSDASTTEFVLDYEVRGTSGRLHYVVVEHKVPTASGKTTQQSPLKWSAESVVAAERGKSGVIDVGSTLLVIGDDDHVGDRNLTTAGSVAFRDLAPGGRYDVLLCTESTSGSLSEVTSSVEVGVYPKAPEVLSATAEPVNSSSDAFLFSVGLASPGLVHFVVREAGEEKIRDHTVVVKGTLEVDDAGLLAPSSLRRGGVTGDARRVDETRMGGSGDLRVLEFVTGLRSNTTYEVLIATETTNSHGVYRAYEEPLRVRTHSTPPPLVSARATPADASSSAIVLAASLETPAEVHYAVFPASNSDSGVGGMYPVPSADGGTTQRSDEGKLLQGVQERLDDVFPRGCENVTVSLEGHVALNKTQGLVASGVVSLSQVVSSGAKPASEVVLEGDEAAKAIAATGYGTETIDLDVVDSAAGLKQVYEAVVRVEGLEAAKAYDVCLFTETPLSHGLFGRMYTLRGVETHAPIPELASERVACVTDCRALNRDPCWLEANKCGECTDGFVGKAGHANSPCGKVASLTEDDITRIAEREQQSTTQALKDSKRDIPGLQKWNHLTGSQTIPHTQGGTPSAIPGDGGLLVGIPVAMGSHITRFLYAGVPESNGSANDTRFDAEAAASGLCAQLDAEGGEPPACAAKLAAALASRFHEGHFHASDAERPVLQVEIDAPGGESIAFVLQHGKDAGREAVRFCRENQALLLDEQECVIKLMQGIGLA